MMNTDPNVKLDAHLAPAASKMGLLKLSSKNSPDVSVAAPTRLQRSTSIGMTQRQDIGMKMLNEYPACEIAA